MPKPRKFYLSYSRIFLYNTEPLAYFTKYILGVEKRPTRNMVFGSIGHKAISDPSYDWRTALRKEKFLSSQERVMERALAHVRRSERSEVEMTVKHPTTLLYGILDGLDKSPEPLVREYKWSAGGVWNKQKVREDLQLSLYQYMVFLKTGELVEGELDAINTKTGRITPYPKKRLTKREMEGLDNLIKYCHHGITNKLWDQ